MSNFAICDQSLVEAKFVPPACFGPPGGCPPGLYHTFYRHDGYVGLLELRMRYFAEQLRLLDHEPMDYTGSLFSADLLHDLLEKEELLDAPARVRMMVFDRPLQLSNGQTTQVLSIVQPVTGKANPEKAFRCAVAPRRRLEIIDTWEMKRLGRRQIDQDLAAAKERGFDDVLYLDRLGQWCDASYSNLVAVFGNRICVAGPPGLAYRGLTAGIFSAIKGDLKPLQVHSAAIAMKEIAKADEVFLTSAVRGLQTVTEIEGIGTWPLDPQNSVRKRIYEHMTESGIL
jgi:branched-subunit amino acid aminotransferase/4-amino-4-deoxychorismate lyase